MDKKLTDYYEGRLSPEEESLVQKWLVARGEDKRVSDMLEQKFRTETEAEAGRLRCGRYGLRTHGAASLAAACLAGLILISAVFSSAYFMGRSDAEGRFAEAEWCEYKVSHGQTHKMVLPDSSVLYLNAGSRITYPSRFDGDERKIFVDGEVWADITHDPEHPFVICAGDTRLKVYGTTFNYKAYGGSECVEVLLLDGSVSLDVNVGGQMRSIQMAPGDMVQYNRRYGSVDMQAFDAENYKSFHERHSFHFFNLTMSDIAMDLSRHFGTKIIVTDEKLADTHFFAYFTNDETLEQILGAMNSDGKMNIMEKDGVIYLSSGTNIN